MRILGSLVGISLLLLIAPYAGAQEQEEDERYIDRSMHHLDPSPQLARDKRREAAEGNWAWTLLGSFAVGYDTNIYESPSGETGSGIGQVGLRAEGLRHFENGHRLKLSATTIGSPYLETSDVSEYMQQVKARYRWKLSDRFRFGWTARVAHENDNEFDQFGGELSKNYENFNYRTAPSVSMKLWEDTKLKLALPLERKDYAEQSDKESLDWQSYGGEFSFGTKLSRTVKASGRYGFSIRSYDEDGARSSSGDSFAINPDEKHHYHHGRAQLAWSPSKSLGFTLGYDLRHKADQFEGYETYTDQRVKLGTTLNPTSALTLGLTGSFAHRQYDGRESDEDDADDAKLKYDRVRATVFARYRVSKNLSWFARYDFADRDSNRDTGTTYRDYRVHRLLAGLSVGY